MKTALADMDTVGRQLEKPVLVRCQSGRWMAVHRLRLDTAGLALAPPPFDRRRRAEARAELPASTASISVGVNLTSKLAA